MVVLAVGGCAVMLVGCVVLWLVVLATVRLDTGAGKVMRQSSDSDRTLDRWRAVGVVVWVAVVLAVGVVSRVVPSAQVCHMTTVRTVRTDQKPTVERSRTAQGQRSSSSSTTTGRVTQRTRDCAPVSVPELAVLSVPILFFLAPIIEDFDIAGIHLRLARKRLAEVGAPIDEGLEAKRSGHVSDLSKWF